MFKSSAAPLVPGFLVVHANLPEQLRALVVQWTKAYPLAVLESETVLVQSNGIAQWLKLALAADPDPADATQGGAGIACGLSLQMPGRFIWQLYRLMLPAQAIPEQSGFDKSQLRWRLFRLLPQLALQDEFAVIASYLQGDDSQGKLQQLAFKLADLFDQYQVYRADWLQAWGQGKDVLVQPQGQSISLAAEQLWQPALWRAILADVPVIERQFSRASLHQSFLKAAASFDLQHRPAGLPRRVIVFGVSSLPQQVLEALAAIAPYTQVLLAVHNPCQHYWADIIADKELFKAQQQRQQRKQSMPAALSAEQLPNHAQPLLAAWGKQGRDYIRLLDEFDQTRQHLALFAGERIDLFSELAPTHLLAQLQADILQLRPSHESAALWPELTEGSAASLCFATAHSAMREIEILHDDLLAQFAADASLTPADIMVMVPDIQQYAPAISAVFGRIPKDDPRYIPFTIADQSALQQEPLLQALQLLLNLRQQRFSVSTVLDLLQLPALQQRFALQPADILLLKHWIEQAQIRWGLDASQRQSLGLPADFHDNSWLHGLQRMLLGYAMGATAQSWQGIAPCAEVAGLSAALAGQLALLLDTLTRYWQQSAERRTPAAWQQWLQQLLADFFLPQSQQEQSLFGQLQQALTDWLLQCQQAGLETALELAVVADGWLEPFAGQGLTQRFLAGAVNFATLMPMRAIPFAQIHLLGMNDGDFPRQMARLDFDLMQQQYRPGDRSRRDDDRYLFLEALLSARQRLRISWLGHSVHDNSERAPSVLVGQLRDHLAAVWRLRQSATDGSAQVLQGEALLAALTVHHPLQPFSRRYLQADRRYQSYQHEWRALYTALPAVSAEQAATALALPEQLPAWDLERLAQWLKDPVRFFFRQRLKVDLDFERMEQPQTESFELDGLARWQLQQRLQQKLQAALHRQLDWRQSLQQELQQIQAEGLLPVAAAGQLLQQQLQQLFSPQAEQFALWVAAAPPLLEAPIWCQFSGNDQHIADWLKQLRRQPDGALLSLQWLVGALYKDKQLDLRLLFKPWLTQLLAAAGGHSLTLQLLAADTTVQLPPISMAQATAQLQQLSGWLTQSLCRPLPLEQGCALLLLQAELPLGQQPDDKLWAQLQKRYHGDSFVPGVLSRNRYLARAYADFDALWQQGELHQVATGFYQGLRDYLRQAGIEESL